LFQKIAGKQRNHYVTHCHFLAAAGYHDRPLHIQAANKPPEPPPKQKLLVEDIQGIVVVYAGEKTD
jgi:hypothetical protein